MGSVSRAARTRSLSRDIPPSRSWLSGSAWIRRFRGAASGPWKPPDGGGHLRPAAGVGPGPEGDQGPRSDRGGPRAPEADALARSAGDPGCGADREPGNPEGGGKKRSPEGRSRAICRSWCRRSGYGSRIRGYGSGPQMFGRPKGARSAGAPGAEAGEARGTGLIPGGGGWRAWAEALWLDPTVPLWAVEAGSTRSMGGAVTPPAQDSKARELMTRADEGGQRPDRWHFPRTLRRPGPSHPKSPAGSLGPSHLTDSQNLIMIISKP